MVDAALSAGGDPNAVVPVAASLSAGGGGDVAFIPTEHPAPAPAVPVLGSWPEQQVTWRVSELYGPPTIVGWLPSGWQPTSVTREPWGWWRITVGGVDKSFFRGAPTLLTSWEDVEPFGSGPAQLQIPRITPFDQPGAGELAWLTPGADVALVHLRPDSTTDIRWAGIIAAEEPELDESSWTYKATLLGSAFVSDLQTHKPPTWLPPTDIGWVIADTLNQAVSRRTATVARVTTGILTTQRGDPSSGVVAYCQELLGTATTDDGANQWTVARIPGTQGGLEIRLKDRTTVHWMVRAGQRGASVRLTRDSTQAANRIYGRGVRTDGYSWENRVYPDLRKDTAPAYPYSGAGHVMTVGSTDAGTTTGHGVSDFQRRVNELGLTGTHVAVDGVYNTADAKACRVVQKHFGIQVDEVCGPQTWAALFDVGANAGDLSSSFRLPLAWDPKVMPRLYNADGSDAGPNPAYDPAVPVVDRDENFGPGISKEDGRRSAVAELARSSTPGWVGTIVLRADPNEGSRWDIQAGQNILLRGWMGA
ncbi:MAG TPA: peptidoglycan-binding domain-containing protein, partial [Kineosporiaceae bacterium]|nr:peptidoglycan-binding domain-containing protein [Kineosporiaceae bacterium]